MGLATFERKERMLVEMTVKGERTNVSLGEKRSDGSYAARIRKYGTGNSVRGRAKQNSLGVWRFTPTNPSSLN